MTKKERNKQNAKEIWDNILSKEIPVPDGYTDFLVNKVFGAYTYLFMYRKGKRKYGHCTRCNTESEIDLSYRHNDEYRCPRCGAAAVCKDAGRSRSRLCHYHDVTCIQQTKQGGIIIRSAETRMDYSKNYKNVMPDEATPWYVAYFEPEYYGIFCKTNYYDYALGKWNVEYQSQLNAPGNAIVRKYNDSPYDADYVFGMDEIEKKRMQYCPLAQYKNAIHRGSFKLSRFLQFYCDYPILCEKLVKEGYHSLVEERLEYNVTGGLNFKAKTVKRVLGLNKMELDLLKTTGCNPSIHYVKAMQYIKKNGLSINRRNCDFAAGVKNYNKKSLSFCLQYATLQQIIKITDGAGRRVRDYKDYLDECITLRYDMADKSVLIPDDLQTEHARTSELIRELQDKEKQAKLKKITDQFQKKFLPAYQKKFSFASGDYLIRPGESAQELEKEGAALSHCVGGYAKRYLSGDTIILFIREKRNPNKPFYTMEISKTGTIIQCRTKCNQSYTENPAVSAFIQEWQDRTKKKKQAVA